MFKVDESSDFEEENNKIAKAIVDVLKTKGVKVSDTSIEEGLLIKQPCRMEELPRNLIPKWAEHKRIFFDVGHNPQAIVFLD